MSILIYFILSDLKKNKALRLIGYLLVSNAFCMETLPICLDSILPAWLAITLSTTFVVIFGEILPQAYCTGPSQIKIAAKMAPIVTVYII